MVFSSNLKLTRRFEVQSLAGPGLFALSVAAATLVFWSGLSSLVDAWSIPEYSHGPIIPLISTFLFLRELRMVPPVERPVTDRWPGVVVLAFGIAIGIMGSVIRIPDIVTYGFIIWIAGLILVIFGLRRGFLFWPAVVHLIFMLPLPQFVYWQVSVYLQSVSSQIGVALIQLFEIPVYLDGNVIDLGVYKLLVAEACSGLRYLFPMLSFSYVFAVLYNGPKWHKVVLLLSAAPITVAMNSFRIGMIGVLVDSYGIEQAEGFLHTFEGWVIFIACVVILFCLATLLQQLGRNPRPLSETLDIEFSGMGAQLRRITAITPSLALSAAVFFTAAAGVAWTYMPERAVVEPQRDPLALFPMRIDAWRGVRMTLEPEIERVLGADDYHTANYLLDAATPPVDLFIAYYRKQTEGSGIHSPEVCLPSGGWEVSRWRADKIKTSSGKIVPVNRAVIQKGADRQLVYYWFEQRGRRMTSDYAAKAVTVLDSLRTGRTDGGIVRLITPMLPQESEDAAEKRIAAFLDNIIDILPGFIPD